MRYKTYPAYKPSGVEWLGDIPEHWNMKPIKYTASCNDEVISESADDDYEIEYVDISSVDKYAGVQRTETMLFKDAPSRARRKVRDGDVIVSTVRTYLRSIASIHQPADNLIVSTGFAVIRPLTSLNAKFAHYLFKADYIVDEVIARSVGVSYPAINSSELIAIKAVLPTYQEQQSIANFLDTKTSLIDDLIAKKERQIELLKEKRTALINKAVTKGLNPDAPMKDSGIEWLGEVPEHWSVKRLRFVVEMNPSKSEVRILDKDTLVSFLPMEAIGSDGTLNLVQEKAINEVDTGYTFVREGDVAIAKITPCFENGKGAIMRGLLNGYGFGTTELIVARPKEGETISKYLYLIFTSSPFRKFGESYMYGAGGQKRVPDDFVRNFSIALPPVSEQIAIVDFLECETSNIDGMINFISQHITKLREYRQTLITAAVTGKIDIRVSS